MKWTSSLEDQDLILTGCRILMAEHDSAVREASQLFLEFHGAHVTSTHGNYELAKMDQLSRDLTNDVAAYDVILLDIIFPDFDGIEVARKLRSENCCSPIIALTSSVRDYHFNQCLKAGCDDCITKTEIAYKLIPIITNLLKM